MDKYTKEEVAEALNTLNSFIRRCEKAQQKVVDGTSQHTLLKNRLQALYIVKSLVEGEECRNKYTKTELNEALLPISSIIHKCEKAQEKYIEGSRQYIRFENMIRPMRLSRAFLVEEVQNKA